MDDNVMNKYTKVAELPRHFVQYDQGENNNQVKVYVFYWC